ncbi:MAG: sugar ABC transporter permease [Candidatus Micrarchaeaceae archaeon]
MRVNNDTLLNNNLSYQNKKKRFNIISSRFIFLIPSLVFLIAFTIIPIIMIGVISFFSWALINPMKFIGIENFINMFKDANFWTTLIVTFKFELLTVPLTFVISLILALLLYKQDRFSLVMRGFFYWPYTAPAVVSGTLMAWLFSTNTGLINYFLIKIGLSPVSWLQGSFTALLTLSFAQVWGLAGFMMVIFIVGLHEIPQELNESASLDGATKLQIFRYITLPLLRGSSTIVLVLTISYSWNNFTLMYIMTTGGPGYATTITSLYVYQLAFTQFRIGYAAAVSVITVVISIVIALVSMKVLKWEA